MADRSDEFSGTMCSICYEGLKPITEDLQSISISGHVFHELCLQQWFEYSKAKKHTCPVCKQGCKANDACRFYFQSIGEGNEAVPSQKPLDFQENAGVLRKEVKLLEVKVSVFNSQLERKGKELEEVTQEELEKSSFERFRLEERNMALAKELAALKLSYKELMAKCNLLGRNVARYSKKPEKAKEKITKLKAKVQELETAAEVKENEYLMSHKESKSFQGLLKTVSILILMYWQLANIHQKNKGNKLMTLDSNSKSVQSLNIVNSDAAENKAVNFGN